MKCSRPIILLPQIKDEMFLTNKEHSGQLQRMEHKFFEEKIRLQQEASQKIAELAERAHTEAIRFVYYSQLAM